MSSVLKNVIYFRTWGCIYSNGHWSCPANSLCTN